MRESHPFNYQCRFLPAANEMENSEMFAVQMGCPLAFPLVCHVVSCRMGKCTGETGMHFALVIDKKGCINALLMAIGRFKTILSDCFSKCRMTLL